MPRKRKFIIALCIFLVACLLLGALKFSNQLKANELTSQEITSVRKAAKTAANSKVSVPINELEKMGITSSPTYNSAADICYIDHQDMGWFTRNWYEQCYLHFVSGFTTSLSRDEVMQKISENPTLSSYFSRILSPKGLGSSVGKDCVLLDSNNGAEIIYIPANYQPGRRDYKCTIDLTKGSDSGALSTKPSVKIYYSFDRNTVDSTRNQVWLIYDEYYYNQDLGCSMKPLCLQPRTKFVHPAI